LQSLFLLIFEIMNTVFFMVARQDVLLFLVSKLLFTELQQVLIIGLFVILGDKVGEQVATSTSNVSPIPPRIAELILELMMVLLVMEILLQLKFVVCAVYYTTLVTPLMLLWHNDFTHIDIPPNAILRLFFCHTIYRTYHKF